MPSGPALQELLFVSKQLRLIPAEPDQVPVIVGEFHLVPTKVREVLPDLCLHLMRCMVDAIRATSSPNVKFVKQLKRRSLEICMISVIEWVRKPGEKPCLAKNTQMCNTVQFLSLQLAKIFFYKSKLTNWNPRYLCNRLVIERRRLDANVAIYMHVPVEGTRAACEMQS
ncbi:hypothetical protein KIN20_023499 [Parelaphostrongylus tenuis]|uniref:Uncharacterized protein n=1 Tax=Parelaphostrongylus tenuis TaxID=148309 RepID=A0AAD5MS39_PARTN|nr:hypothetical protein KIN20_023499 [Parelaphostrongylus tenuis]